MDRVQQFLLELGEGFALYARQRRIKVGTKEFVIDLIFFHVVHQRFVIVELKVDAFDPSQIGQLQFYVEWAERHLRGPEHQPTVGILLVDDKDDVVVHYALAAASSPLAVSAYTYDGLPRPAQDELRSTRGLAEAVHPSNP